MNRQLDLQITRTSIIWLLVSQVLIMLPFLPDMPFWLFPLLIISAVWRFRMLKGHAQQPSRLVKWSAVGLGVAGLVASGLDGLSLEAATALLLLGHLLKNLELVNRRDGLIVIFIGFFLIATQFLYSQEILNTLYALFLMLVLVGALISLHQPRSHSLKSNLRLATLMLAQCIPLMLVCYLFFPRLPPLWTIPLPEGRAETGISDRITPGDVADLARSAKLAFRVTIEEGDRPVQSELYWRGLVLNHFDGKTWSQLSEADQEKMKLRVGRFDQYSPIKELFDPVVLPNERKTVYSAIYQASYLPWIYTLSPSVVNSGEARLAYDYRVFSKRDIVGPTEIRLTGYPGAPMDLFLKPWVKGLALQLPEGENPRMREFARRQRALYDSDFDFAKGMMNYINEQPFYYTLRPPTLGDKDTIDKFFFDTQRGFCSHYAGAFINLMRAVGIPARMVVGYQGGEWNSQGGYFAVHQFDAHAWTEIWIQGEGWIRLDPTAMVAPDRIEFSLQDALSEEGSFLEGSLLTSLQFSMFNSLRMRLDSMQYQWQKWVVNYDYDDQTSLLSEIAGELDVTKAILIAISFITGLLLFWLIMLGLLRRPKPVPMEVKLYRDVVQRLSRLGFPVHGALAPTDLVPLVGERLWKPELDHFVGQLNQRLYQPDFDQDQLKSAHQQLVRALKRDKNQSLS